MGRLILVSSNSTHLRKYGINKGLFGDNGGVNSPVIGPAISWGGGMGGLVPLDFHHHFPSFQPRTMQPTTTKAVKAVGM